MAQIDAQLLQFPTHATELSRMCIASDTHGRRLGKPRMALAKIDAKALCVLHQKQKRLEIKPPVRGISDRLLLHRSTTVMRSSEDDLAVPVSRAASTLTFSIWVNPSVPILLLQRVIVLASIGIPVWKNSKPQKNCQYGFSTQRSTVSRPTGRARV